MLRYPPGTMKGCPPAALCGPRALQTAHRDAAEALSQAAKLAFDDQPPLMAGAKLGMPGSSLIAGVPGAGLVMLTRRVAPD